MTQIIKLDNIDFNKLVNDNNNGLSLNFQSKMINTLSANFTEEEQRWYIANLYVYLNYHPSNDFPINLENVFKMMGFAHKKNAKRTLENNFTKDEDYKVLLLPTEKQKNDNRGGHNEETIMLNVDTFKNMCMMVKSDKAKQIRRYYIKLENIYNQIIKEEIEEKEKLLEEKDELLQEQQKKIELLENKPKTHGFLTRRHGFVYIIKERSKNGHYKIGMAYNVDKRLRNLNTGSSEISIYHEIETYDCELLEKTVHSILQPFNICGRKEWFYFSNEKEVNYALYIMQKTHQFLNNFNFNSLEQFRNYIQLNKINIIEQPQINQPQFNPNKTQQAEKNQNEINQNEINQNEINQIETEQNQIEQNQETTIIRIKKKETKNQENINETNIYKLTGQRLNNKTGNYKGVCWSKEKKQWKAELKLNYKNTFLGYHSTELDGAKAYNDYVLYINNKMATNYSLNEIPDYTPTPRNIPEETKSIQLENKTSKFNGVSYDSKRGYYVVSIKYNGKSYNLGNHALELECAKIYNQQALFFNNHHSTKYSLNDIPDYITTEKNIYEELQNKKENNKSSKYHGVTFDKRSNKFKALLVYNKKQIHIGTFIDELDAAKAYNIKAQELNKDFNCKYKINSF